MYVHMYLSLIKKKDFMVTSCDIFMGFYIEIGQ